MVGRFDQVRPFIHVLRELRTWNPLLNRSQEPFACARPEIPVYAWFVWTKRWCCMRAGTVFGRDRGRKSADWLARGAGRACGRYRVWGFVTAQADSWSIDATGLTDANYGSNQVSGSGTIGFENECTPHHLAQFQAFKGKIRV